MIKQLLNSLGITNESLSSSLVSDVVFTEKVNGLIVTVERNENDLFFITGLNAEGSSELSFYFKNDTVFLTEHQLYINSASIGNFVF